MIAVFRPGGVSGAVAAPPSKSLGHRLLIGAGLAAGESVLEGLEQPLSQDLSATLDCLAALGCRARWEGGRLYLSGGDPAHPAARVWPCRESGSTLRFFLPLALLSGEEITLTGSETLLGRPLGPYETLCRERGMTFALEGAALRVRGPLKPGAFTLPGNVSSQFVTGLLLALPLLPGDSTLTLSPPVESRPYIDMTLSALETFGVRIEPSGPLSFRIPGNQRGRGRAAAVEGDWSNAAFFLALGLPVTGLREDSLQGDRAAAAHLRALREGPAEIDLSQCPDLGPLLFAFAAAHHGGRFTGTRRLRDKESDRVAAMAEELAKFGAALAVEENAVTVPAGIRPPKEDLFGHNDHRVVMALSVLCVEMGGRIRGAQAVTKSFPDFFDRLRAAGASLTLEDAPEERSMEHGMDQ